MPPLATAPRAVPGPAPVDNGRPERAISARTLAGREQAHFCLRARHGWGRLALRAAALSDLGDDLGSAEEEIQVDRAVGVQDTENTTRRGGRARLKASDSKSDRGVSPSGVQILSPPPKFRSTAGDAQTSWRGGRVAEGAALEMPCTGNCTVGSNPTPSAIHHRWKQGIETGSRVETGRLGSRQPARRGRARRGGSGAL